MPWVRIDEAFPDHPKVMKAGPLGIAMQVAALCYCNRYLTDGFVPRATAAKLLAFDGLGVTWETVVGDLEAAGLWEPIEGGWRLHDYHDYQPKRDDVEARRLAEHAGKVAGGKARAAGAKRDRGKFTKAQVNTSTASRPPAGASAGNQQRRQQRTSPVPVTPLQVVGKGTGGRGVRGEGEASPSSATPSGDADSASPRASRCRHRNDPTTCGICSPAIGQPPPRSALAAVLAPTAHANLDDVIYDDDRPVHDVGTQGGRL